MRKSGNGSGAAEDGRARAARILPRNTVGLSGGAAITRGEAR